MRKIENNIDKDILGYLKIAKRRLNTNVLLDYSIKGMIVGILAALLFVLICRFIPIYKPYIKSIYIISTFIIIGLVYGLFKRYDEKKTALKVDSFGFEERIITSLELKKVETNFALMQKKDTLSKIKDFDYKKYIPLRVNKKYLTLCVTLLILFGASSFLPNSMKGKAEEIHNIKEAKKTEVKKVEDIKKELSKDEKLTKEAKEALDKELSELQKEIKESKTLEDIDKNIDKKEKKIDIMKKNYEDEELRKLADAFEKNKLTKEIAKTIKENNKDDLSNKLKDLMNAVNNMSKEDREALMKALSEMAKGMENNPGLKNNLESLAKGLNNSNVDMNELMKNLNNLSSEISNLMDSNKSTMEALNNAKNMLSNMERASQSSGENSQSGSEVSSNTEGASSSSGEGSKNQGNAQQGNQQNNNGQQGNGQQGEGQQSGGNSSQGANQQGNGGNQQGSGNGSNGSSSGKGQGAGNGSGMGTENGGTSQGGNSGAGIGSKGESEGKTANYEPIFTSKNIGGQGEESELKGQKNNGEGTEVMPSGNVPTIPGQYIPYDQVIGEYKQQALENFNSSTIPEGMKEIVKNYFSSLEE